MSGVENNDSATSLITSPTVKRVGGITGKGFMPGQVANPGGRPKGLAAYIRERTHDGRDLVDFVVDVFQGNGERLNGHPPKLEVRFEAATWLADRGFGKPVQTIAHTGDDGGPVKILDLTILTAGDLDHLESVLARGVKTSDDGQESTSGASSAGEQSSGGQGSSSAGPSPDVDAIDGQYRPVDETTE